MTIQYVHFLFSSIQAMIDVAAESGWLGTTLQIQTLLQMIVQGSWHNQSSLLTLPHLEHFMMYLFKKPKQFQIDCLPVLMDFCEGKCKTIVDV